MPPRTRGRAKGASRARESLRRERWSLESVARTLVWASPAILLATMGYTRRWVSEDAFIDFRIVRNLLVGHGPVFNLNERVEAYTNPLWVALLALWGSLGGRLEIGAIVLGMVLSIAGVLMAQSGARILASRLDGRGDDPTSRTRGGLAVPLGMLVFAAVPAVWDFVTSGLETGLVIGWLGLAFWLVVRSASLGMGARYLSAVVLGLGPLIRPDLALLSVALFVGLALADVGDAWAALRRGGRLALAALALPIAYQVFRMGYFAALVPNTALAKEAGAAYWAQGWLYVADFLDPYVLWVPLVLLLPWWVALLRRAGRERAWSAVALLLGPVLAALVHAVYVARVGGDFMHGRFLLPTLLAALLPMASVRWSFPPASVTWSPALHSLWRLVTCLGIVVWAGICASHLRVPYAGGIGPRGIADERGVYSGGRQKNPIFVEDYGDTVWARWGASFNRFDAHRGLFIDAPNVKPLPLGEWVPASTQLVVTFQNIGIFGYVAGARVHVVDRVGLSDPIASRLRLDVRGRPGHEKRLPPWWAVARFADREAIRRMYPESAPAVDAARDVLRCGAVAALLQAIESPLTAGRFLGNMRLAWTLRDLRIPPDPSTARAALCVS